MTPTTLRKFRKLLTEKLNQDDAFGVGRDDLIAERASDPMDELQWKESIDLSIRTLTLDWNTRREIRDALGRIDGGEFGSCASCGEAIGEKRMQALPWAKLCMSCKQLEEQDERELERVA